MSQSLRAMFSILIPAAGFFVAMMTSLVLTSSLRSERKDIVGSAPLWSGRSAIWWVNVLDQRNYTPRGKARLKFLWIALVCEFVFALLIIRGVVRR